MRGLERLSVLDELFLHLEGPNTHMHVGGAAVFKGPPPDYEELLDMVRRRLQLVPRFRQRLAFVPFGLGRPVWVDDIHFNLEYHVRHTAMPSPGDDSKFRRLVGRIMSQQLDRSKPLWEIWFAEGVRGDRFALISKSHHCLVDGVSGVDIMSVLLDTSPQPKEVEPEPWRPKPEPTADQLIADALQETLTSPTELVRSLQSAMMDPGRLPNKLLEAAKAVGALVGGTLELAPSTSLNQMIGPHRRIESLTVKLEDLKRVKKTLGGTVNDVVLAMVTGGLRHLLQARSEPVEDIELRALVPVSVRARVERGALGNRLAAMWAPLPVFEADPVKRLRLVTHKMRDLRSSGQAVGARILASIGEYAPPTILAQASRLVARQRAYNLVITNVPGPQFPLYCLGRQLQEVYPVVPLSHNTTLGVALLSYNGTVGLGLTGDYDTAPDLVVLAEGIEKSITELLFATQ
jgi:diacylglycerol O-acyltransferase / wax synthase